MQSQAFRAAALSKLLAPLDRSAKGKVASSSVGLLDGHGYVRQVGSGIYDLLPLGLRMQKKIVQIIRKHLDAAQCTELELSTLVNPQLWHASGRLDPENSNEELMFTDGRRNLLAPTGEEQITRLVGSVSYRQLPLSLYQISRKFRNELRPRGGLLRTREFLMKDLYTFDVTESDASESYHRIKASYKNIFDEIGIPYVVAEADSGNMGGNLSHEYHYVSSAGEDSLVSCHSCGYRANLETAQSKSTAQLPETRTEEGARIPANRRLSLALLRRARENNSKLVDWALDPDGVPLVEPEVGDSCAGCGSKLEFETGIEVGHTFFLGDRYSKPMKSLVSPPSGGAVPIQMGCYGIGVTRIIAAIAEKSIDEHGLVWPRSIAPFECVVVSKNIELAREFADELATQGIEVAFDDRTSQIGQAMRAARESGFPLTVVLGRSWDKESLVEILPRQGSPAKVPREALASTIQEMLATPGAV